MTKEERGVIKGGKPDLARKRDLTSLKTAPLTLIYTIVTLFVFFSFSIVSATEATEMIHRVTVTEGDVISVYVTTSEVSEITLERFEPVKAGSDIRYNKANYKIIGLNCIVGNSASFRLQPISRGSDIVIPITIRYRNDTRTMTYTILAKPTPTPLPAVAVAPPPTSPAEQNQQPTRDSNFVYLLVAIAIFAVLMIGVGIIDLAKRRTIEKK